MREIHEAAHDMVRLRTVLTIENSVKLDSAMNITGHSETDTVNRAIAMYAAIVVQAENPRTPEVGVTTGRGLFKRVVSRFTFISEADDD